MKRMLTMGAGLAAATILFSSATDGRAQAAPTAPAYIWASDATYSNYVRVTWTSCARTYRYEVWRGDTTNSAVASLLGESAALYLNDASAAPGTVYFYFVRARGTNALTSAFSRADAGSRPADVPPPEWVTASDGAYTDRVDVAWASVADATSYEIFRGTSSNALSATRIGVTDATAYSDVSASAGVVCYYWVRSVSAAGVGWFNTCDSGFRAASVPVAPTYIAASDGTYTGLVRVTWGSSTGATAYEVWRATESNTALAAKLADATVPSSDDASAVPGTIYWYWIKARNSAGTSGFSPGNSGYRPLLSVAAPAWVTASDAAYTDRVAVAWAGVAGATNYQVWRATSSNSLSAALVASPVATSFNDTSAPAGVVHWYWVRTVSAAGTSPFGACDPGSRSPGPPTAPSALSASDGAYSNLVRVAWTAVAGATGYEVWSGATNDAGSATLLATLGATTVYDDTSTTAGVIRWYWVRALNAIGAGGFSPGDPGYRPGNAAPPTEVWASDGAFTDRVDVVWTVSPGVSGYEVWRASSSNAAAATRIGTSATTNYSDASASAHVTYWYWVCSSNLLGSGPFGANDTGWRTDVPAAPAFLAASDGSFADRVQLWWGGSTAATSYELWRSTVNDSGSATLLTETAATNHSDTTAAAGAIYYYWAKAKNAVGAGDFSPGDAGFRSGVPPAPSTVSASDGSYGDRVAVSWGVSAGAVGYEIWRGTNSTSAAATRVAASATTAWDDTGATANLVYYYWIKATNAAGAGAFSPFDTGFRSALPSTPATIAASDGTYTDRVALTWSAATGATGYELWRGATNNSAVASRILVTGTTNADDTGTAPGVLCYYWVRATNIAGISAYSPWNSGYRGGPPVPPTFVRASDAAYTDRVTVVWNGSVGATSYEVWRSATNLSSSATLLATGTSTNFADTSAAMATTYFYWIKAVNSLGTSGFSTGDPGSLMSFAPGAPLSVWASDGTYGEKVVVYWSVSAGATSYEIWRAVTNLSTAATLIAEPPTPQYLDTSATPGVTYYYWAKARNVIGTSGFSPWDSGYRALGLPAAPASIAASDGTYTDRVEVTWASVAAATGYDIWRSATNASASATRLAGLSTNAYSDTSAVAGQTYYYWARATNAAGASGMSVSDSGFRSRSPPAAPGWVSASDGLYTYKIGLSWTAATGADGYEVWRGTNSSSGLASRLTTVWSATNYDDSVASPGLFYYYWVRSTNSAGISAFGASDVGYRRLSPPSYIAASDGAYTDRVAVSWGWASGATQYQLWRSTNTLVNHAEMLAEQAATNYNDATAAPLQTYYYWARAKSETGTSVFSPSNSGWRAGIPAAPAWITASDGTYTDRVAVVWRGSFGATGYEVWRSTTNDSAQAAKLADAASTNYNDTSATFLTPYFYWIKAKSSAGTSAFSPSDSGYRFAAPPAAPSNVSASDGTYQDHIAVVWAASGGADGYEVWRAATNDTASASRLADVGIASYDDTAVSGGETWYYWVKATNVAGVSAFSAGDSGYVPAGEPTTPAWIAASDGSWTDRVQVTWAAATNATGYEIWRGTNADPSAGAWLGDSTNTLYDDFEATPDATFWYFVRAMNSSGVSAWSTPDSGFRSSGVPLAPTNVVASDGAFSNLVIVTWDAAAGATAYVVFKAGTNNIAGATFLGATTIRIYTNTPAAAGVTNYYWVKATNASGMSAYSSPDAGWAWMSNSPPAWVSATDGAYTDKVVVAWAAVPAARGYQVWRSTNSNSGVATMVAGLSAASTNYNDTAALGGRQYWYWAKASNVAAAVTGFSPSDSGYRLLSPPGKPTASDGVYTNRINVWWPGSGAATNYELWRSASGFAGDAILIAANTGTNYNDYGISNGLPYYYYARAYTPLCTSAMSLADSGYLSINTTLAAGQPVTIGIAPSNTSFYFVVNVPDPTNEALWATTAAATTNYAGDCDLYIRLGSRPTTSNYNARSINVGTTEKAVVDWPAASNWFIMVKAVKAFTNVTLNADYGSTNNIPP